MDSPKISTLSRLATDNDYVRRNPAPNFWALMPHQLHQHTDSSCSLASAVMVLNAARGVEGQNRISGLVSEKRLLDLFDHTDWRAGIAPEGGGRKLLELADHLEQALAYYALAGWRVERRPVARADAAALATLRADLAAMEAGAGSFPIANFHLDDFYGDGSDIGHFSPLGAYDAATDRVLVLDVYKADYEPAWAPLPHLLKAMAHPCEDGMLRGYLVVTRG
ncbi:phytochelatin synthase family protein [Dongia rigui]|uniref:glutathione gamma-glutamylcysteinyltransferase n=1 Tax=Dongia rigui TaxID=940149 RepID=A0ABU5DXW8_9PROT|nr:phytochelatin synthase family protein [Dongia rigui]MDY0871852.1 phytochelatin synthase family protein [Dongia rigui]